MSTEVRESGDPRISFVITKALVTFGVPRGKWEKSKTLSIQDENTIRAIDGFLNDIEVPYCFLTPGANDTVVGSRDMPQFGKKKFLIISRSTLGKMISKDNMSETILFIEIGKYIMDLLGGICNGIYGSVLGNTRNQKGWSDLVAKDLINKFHVFVANLHVTCGLIKGLTILPLPSNFGTTSSKDRIHVLESAVITWSK